MRYAGPKFIIRRLGERYVSQVLNAQFKRIVHRNNERMAEVEVRTEDQEQPQTMAYFAREADGQLVMRMAFKKDAEYEIDWYENSYHQAYEEIKNQFNEGNSGSRDAADLSRQILNYGTLRDQLQEELG